jgi:23S rRNA pseudouridine1911/1915/1917 synthase
VPVFKVAPEQVGQRLDVWLAGHFPAYSRAFLQKWVRAGRVTLEGQPREPGYRLKAGERFEVVSLETPIESAVAQTDSKPVTEFIAADVPTPTILFEDKAILVLDKPAGLVVHPAPSYRGATLMDWLKKHLGGKVTTYFTDPERLGLVHRLDKDTSGVLLIAKSVPSQVALAKQFKDRTMWKDNRDRIQELSTRRSDVRERIQPA